MTDPELITSVHAVLSALAAKEPTAVLLAMLDQLVEVACCTNPALKDHMLLQFYRGVLRKLQQSGVVPS